MLLAMKGRDVDCMLTTSLFLVEPHLCNNLKWENNRRPHMSTSTGEEWRPIDHPIVAFKY